MKNRVYDCLYGVYGRYKQPFGQQALAVKWLSLWVIV